MSEAMSLPESERPRTDDIRTPLPVTLLSNPSRLVGMVLLSALILLLGGTVGGFALGRWYERNDPSSGYVEYLLGAHLEGRGDNITFSAVVNNGPAYNAGLYEGDRLDRIGSERISSLSQARRLIAAYRPGETVLITVERPPYIEQVAVQLGVYTPGVIILPEPIPQPLPVIPTVPPPQWQQSEPRLGVYYRMLEPGDVFAVADGALIITAGSPAADAGLQVGDIITRVDGTQINQSYPLEVALDRFGAGQRVRLTIDRAGETLTIRVALASR